jgi:PAS domain S-box-containing protein
MPAFASLLSPDHIVWALVHNAALLIALAYVYSLFLMRRAEHPGAPLSLRGQITLGAILGFIGIAVILAAYPFGHGIIFDTRSVLLGLSGLFFGLVPTLVAVAITGAFRLFQGGDFAWIGLAVIVASGGVGLLWRRVRKPDLQRVGWGELLAFGFALHLVMLAIFLSFPARFAAEVFALITIPVLGIYPATTAVLGKLLAQPLRGADDTRRLRESEERLNLVLKGTNDGWWDWDLATNRLTYSDRWWHMLGRDPDDHVAGPELWRELMHPDDLDRVNAGFTAALESTRLHYEIEFRLQHRAGHYLSVISRGHIVRDAQGRPRRVAGTNVDITPLRRAIDEANIAKSYLEAAGRMARIGYWAYHFDQPDLVWSDITCEIHDLPPGTRPTLAEAVAFYPIEHREAIAADVRRAREQGRSYENEYQIITARGRRIWILTRGQPVRDEKGRVVGVRGVIQDIDGQKRAAEALLQSERNYREIFDASNDAIFIHEEATGRIIDVNEAMLRMYGYPDKASALALNVDALSSGEPPYSPRESILHVQAAQNGIAHVFPWHARRADGSLFWVEVALRRTVINGLPRLLACVRDISQRKALEDRLRESEKMESIGRLAGGIAHDFNNMLGVIIGHADLAELRLQSGASVQSDIEHIRTAGKRSADLIRQLLTFARRQAIHPVVIDVNKTVHNTLDLLRRLIGEHIDLRWLPGPDIWPICIDPVQLDQLLANLVINARDAIAENPGVITIRTLNVPAKSAGSLNDTVVLEISDTGMGMDAETLGHIFEPFFTTKEDGKGTGLGLATVYGIVEQNGGDIHVTSQPGAGACFRISLPRARPGHAPAAHVPDSARGFACAGQKRETLLVVEDEPSVLDLARHVLEMHHYCVLAADRPELAIEIAARPEQALDLVISDIVMPGMNGRQLREELLKIRPNLRVLLISGYAGGADAPHPAGPPVGFLPKPFSADALLHKVREMIDAPAAS